MCRKCNSFIAVGVSIFVSILFIYIILLLKIKTTSSDNQHLRSEQSVLYDSITIQNKKIISLQDSIKILNNLVHNKKSESEFYNKLGFLESTNNYRAKNRFGFIGKYQFSQGTLRYIGIDVTEDEYLSNPDLQEYSVRVYISHHKKILSSLIKKHNNTFVMFNCDIYNEKILITESGILAAAHLAGAGNVRKFFEKNIIFKDGNGVPITKYLKEFSKYHI